MTTPSRQRYVQERHISYPIADWTKEADRAYGGIAIFPTLFLIDRRGVVRNHWIGYVQPDTLKTSITAALQTH